MVGLQEQFDTMCLQIELLKERLAQTGNQELTQRVTSMINASKPEVSLYDHNNIPAPNVNGKKHVVLIEGFQECTSL